MQNDFIVNIIHRPEMVPEYAEKVTGQGKKEDIGRKSLLTESLDIFKFQQATAHKNGLKTTIHMTYASLFNEEAVSIAKHDHDEYGEEIELLPSSTPGIAEGCARYSLATREIAWFDPALGVDPVRANTVYRAEDTEFGLGFRLYLPCRTAVALEKVEW